MIWPLQSFYWLEGFQGVCDVSYEGESPLRIRVTLVNHDAVDLLCMALTLTGCDYFLAAVDQVLIDVSG
jgi:hypothetical protein